MIPPLIIAEALEKEIDILAITDHNAIANIPALMMAAENTGITILPGMELQTREEIHSLCLFDRFDQIERFFASVISTFPDIKNNPDFFGEQFVVDATGDFIRREERLLITSSSLSLKAAWGEVDKLGGLLVPAHANRTAFGLLPVLGFVPDDIPLEIIEISKHLTFAEVREKFPDLARYHLIQGGDAHLLEDIKGWNELTMRKATISEIKMALFGEPGYSYRNLHT